MPECSLVLQEALFMHESIILPGGLISVSRDVRIFV